MPMLHFTLERGVCAPCSIIDWLSLGDGKACSEVEERLWLYLAANSAALDQANGSIGFIGGAAGQSLANIHVPTLEASRRFGNL